MTGLIKGLKAKRRAARRRTWRAKRTRQHSIVQDVQIFVAVQQKIY
jgi:hypothetical protein